MTELLETFAHIIDYVAAGILIVGLVVVLFVNLPKSIREYRRDPEAEFYNLLRHVRLNLGQTLLLSLEVLIVSDILYSILHRTLEDMAILGITVIIRVSLSFFLNVELDHLRSTRKEG